MDSISPASLWPSCHWRNAIFYFEPFGENRQPKNVGHLSSSHMLTNMVVKEKLGNINFFAINNRKIDSLLLEWYETNKRILHKKTISGIAVVMKFLNESQQLSEGDVIYEDDFNIITIEIKACDSLVIRPSTMYEMATVCYEIGNRHVPVFLPG
jgi:urease accessory protein UreE